MSKENLPAAFDPSRIAIFAPDIAGVDIAEVMAENLAGESMSVFELPRVVTPQGDREDFLLDGERVKSFRGIIVFHRMERAFYQTGYDPANVTPPDCASQDNVHGVGTPGGLCELCPNSQYGSAAQGKGKACGETRVMAIMREGAGIMPTIIKMPPTSLKSAKSYLVGLVPRPYYGVVTEFTLVPHPAQGGAQAFSEWRMKSVQGLTPEQVVAVKSYCDGIKPIFAAPILPPHVNLDAHASQPSAAPEGYDPFAGQE